MENTNSSIRRICILGAGFNGLACAHRILSNQTDTVHNEIIILSKEFTPNTVSDVAGGLWLPFKAYHDKILEWSAETCEYLLSLQDLNLFGMKNPFGVYLSDLYYFIHGEEGEKDLKYIRNIIPTEIVQLDLNSMKHPDSVKSIYKMKVPVVNTSQYLETLYKVLVQSGQVKMIRKEIFSIQEVIDEYKPDVVINCLGLGARFVVPDPKVYPTRGALAIVSPKIEYQSKIVNTVYMYDDCPDGLTYIITRPDACFVGGTAYDHSWNLTVDEDEAKNLFERGLSICRYLEGGKIIGTKCGLRPTRKPIRLEIDPSYKDALVIHNYGHGGSGITVHWGCAKDVLELIENHVKDYHKLSKL